MKKYEWILQKLLYERERLDNYHKINEIEVNAFSKGKYQILNEMISYINKL